VYDAEVYKAIARRLHQKIEGDHRSPPKA